MNRIFHPWWEWENVPAGFYEPIAKGYDVETAKNAYAEFLRDTKRFQKALERVVSEWPKACEQFLTNDSINRVAWLGQAAMCIETGVPCWFRAGFQRLSNEEQRTANATAVRCLHNWLQQRIEDARTGHRQASRQLHQDVEGAGLFG